MLSAAIFLCAKVNTRHVLHANEGAVRGGAHDDVLELFDGLETPLGANRVGELLAGGHRLRAESPGQYESYADMAPGQWIPVKIRVDGERAFLHVGGAEQPSRGTPN